MANFPVRQCWLSTKICFLLVLVVNLLSLLNQWLNEVRFEMQIQDDEARIIPGLGEGGISVSLKGTDIKIGEVSQKKYGMNVYLSDRIPYTRTVRDVRNPLCHAVEYDAELPSASIVIIFHNEAYSVLLRTIWSVLNSVHRNQLQYRPTNFIDNRTGARMKMGYKGQPPNSPYLYLKEIILVDDYSNMTELKGKLSHYIKTRLPRSLVQILRLPERSGLIRARQAGVVLARGDVIVILDSHCEATRDWLRPLLHRIKQKRTAVVTPIIDTVLGDSFGYSIAGEFLFQVAGFTFSGSCIYLNMSEREKKRRDSEISPTRTPTMAGGLFAMDREYYWELGGYDEMMRIWGGENLEMAFRVWQCGGSIEKIPCSRVGHVDRWFHAYEIPRPDPLFFNLARMAEVWMDEFAEIFYMHYPLLRNNPAVGDVTQRKALRQKLQCKSFQWYLDNVYPEKFVPTRDGYAYGRFRNEISNLCLDSLQRPVGSRLGLYPCHSRLYESQWYTLSHAGQLRSELDCAEVSLEGNTTYGRLVVMKLCPDADPQQANSRQLWSYSKGIIRNEDSKLCLTSSGVNDSDVLLKRCDGSPEQLWNIDYSEENHFMGDSEHYSESIERQARIWKVLGQRRTSRSLLSVDDNRVEEPSIAINTLYQRLRRKEPKKQNHSWKNNFTLKEEGTRLLSNWSVLTDQKESSSSDEDTLKVLTGGIVIKEDDSAIASGSESSVNFGDNSSFEEAITIHATSSEISQ